MKAAAGASRDQQAAAGLALIFVLAGLAITGVLFLPSLVTRTTLRNNAAEEAMLARLETGFNDYARLYQTIPSASTWASAIASVSGLSVTQISLVFPDFPSDTSVQRAFVIDTFLDGSSPLLPYVQSTNGLTGTATNLLNARARAMIVSTTKRGLSLPISSGFLSQSDFDAIWNWTYNPSTKSPPSGWSSSWTGNGEFLHVKPLYLPNLFSKVTLQNTKYGVGSSNLLTTSVTSQSDYYFLNGTRMALGTTTGTLKQNHVVRRDASFNFGSSGASPLVWFKFEEGSGTLAVNSGTLGSAADGTIGSGITYNMSGPRPSSFPNFSSSNYSFKFDSYDEWVYTTNSVMNNLSNFTMGGWVYVQSITDNRTGLFGQNDAIEIGFITTSSVQIWTSMGGEVTVSWPYANNAWHHIAATGNGTTLKLYFDGAEVGSRTQSTSNYGYSDDTLNVGGSVVFDYPFSYSILNARVDEVVVYNRALSASEVLQLSSGLLP